MSGRERAGRCRSLISEGSIGGGRGGRTQSASASMTSHIARMRCSHLEPCHQWLAWLAETGMTDGNEKGIFRSPPRLPLGYHPPCLGSPQGRPPRNNPQPSDQGAGRPSSADLAQQTRPIIFSRTAPPAMCTHPHWLHPSPVTSHQAQSGVCLTTGGQLRTGTAIHLTTLGPLRMKDICRLHKCGTSDSSTTNFTWSWPIQSRAALGSLVGSKTHPRSDPRPPTSIAEPLHHLSHRTRRPVHQEDGDLVRRVGEVVAISLQSGSRDVDTRLWRAGEKDIQLQAAAARRKRGWGSSSTCPGTAARSGQGCWTRNDGGLQRHLGRPALVSRQATDSRMMAVIRHSVSGHIPVQARIVAQHLRCIVAVLRCDPRLFEGLNPGENGYFPPRTRRRS